MRGALEKFNATKIQCTAVPLTRENAVSQQACINQAWATASQEGGNNFGWVAQRNMIADMESAQAFADGKISEHDYKMAVSLHYADATQEEYQAKMQAQQQQLQALQAYGAMQSAMPRPAPVQPYMMPVNRPVQTNCNGVGNSVNCTSY